MAVNIKIAEGISFYEPSVPDGTKSGNPLVLGGVKPAVALTDRDADGGATVIVNDAVTATFTVVASDGTNDSAIARWDKLYLDGTTINKNSGKEFFGYALGEVAAGQTAEIEVMLG